MTGRRPATPGQTVGPFFGFALPYAGGHELVPPHHPQAVRLHGNAQRPNVEVAIMVARDQ